MVSSGPLKLLVTKVIGPWLSSKCYKAGFICRLFVSHSYPCHVNFSLILIVSAADCSIYVTGYQYQLSLSQSAPSFQT
jgi:hypothetical protein